MDPLSKIKNSNRVVRYYKKNYVDGEIAEEKQVEEDADTKQNAEYTLTINICVPILKNKIPVNVNIERAGTEEHLVDKQNAVLTALIALKIIRNTHAESKKIGVQIDIKRAETGEHHVDKQNAVLTAFPTLKYIKNTHAEPKKTDVKVVGEKKRTEETDR